MRLVLIAYLGLVAAAWGAPIDRLVDFQQYRFGLVPTEFDYDATGPHGPVLSAGRPMWRTYVDLFAPSPKFVLLQASALPKADHYPIALLRGVNAEDLGLAASFKLMGGELARSAGLFWRAQSRADYSAVLVSGRDRRVRLLRMKNGQATESAQAEVTFDQNQWNVLEVSVRGERIRVWLNDRLVLEARDPGARTSGGVGLLTRADTTALFDDLYVQSGEHRVVRKPQLIRN